MKNTWKLLWGKLCCEYILQYFSCIQLYIKLYSILTQCAWVQNLWHLTLKKEDFLKMSLTVKDEIFHINDTNINQILTSRPIGFIRSYGIKLITKRYLWGKYKTYAKFTFNSFRAGQGIKSKWCVIIKVLQPDRIYQFMTLKSNLLTS